ncbi:hypothetical protein FSW04_09965 [Baekduia soli]|uniref:Uncharacterized protein n=1 Tax=Baekduia soli TaxID=496014 RepID=A0A5B8U487_9ACTN|nr:hypothetical protein [Baekduia soli]QEC47863.1 hypothetical protein FSW04_09965 [Baekduia soli]
MPSIERADWYAIRRAQSTRPSTYTCPLCGRLLPAMSEHVLITPLGDGRRRRHAHTACAARARRAGRLPSRDEWRAAQPRSPGILARLKGWRP